MPHHMLTTLFVGPGSQQLYQMGGGVRERKGKKLYLFKHILLGLKVEKEARE